MAKANASRGKTKKVINKETAKKVEEPKKQVVSYLVPIYFQREPIEKDIRVADLFYHVTSNTFELHSHAPQHEAHLEMVIEGDIGIEEKSGSIKMISKAETPKEAKVIFETLQSTVGSTSKRKLPESLSEAVNKSSSVILHSQRNKKPKKKDDMFSDRMRLLAGIKK